MPSTFSSLSYHLVFSTKLRQPLLTVEIRPRVYEYIGGLIRAEGGSLTQIGGVEDHVHLLLKLKPTHTVADFVRVLKANSSKWINDEGRLDGRFAWQEGYSVFTVSQSQVETVRQYLQRQEAHHATRSLADELQQLCERHDVDFDPRSLE
ncbi:IS200/IS605 family transposase [Botrimarina mediterranea]|uniref:Transposase IS200 like protein n=1 Tax=Botrimarina mediterranea TaxID=2528022 RepID=A0A518K5K7_9BACT|nr:IS200/IS605 family transposase [Botrimarina mediterranea]QDV73082.1 Transposase IS200 like protein [Botrimarina mediterranea]